MSNVPIEDAAGATRKIDVFQRTEGPDTVETQAVAIVDPATGNALAPVGGAMPVTGPLTDAQLRASAVPVSAASLPLPTGAATQTTLANIDADLGLQSDAAASSDTGNFSVIAFIKRGLQNWTTLLGRIPALVSGRIPVDGSGVTQPVSGPLTDAQLRAANVNTTLAAVTYPVSTNNSSVAQLGAGASFTGTIETIQNQQAAQISIVCDQAYTVQVQQFIDAAGTQALPVDTFTRAAGVPLNENVTLPGDFFRLVVTNNGGSTTTTLRINTTFGIMGTQPRALTNEGRLPVDAAPPAALLSSYNVAGVIAINTVLLSLDCSQHRSVSVQCVAMGTTGVVTPEWSNDNTTWVQAVIFTPGGVSATTFNAAGIWTAAVAARYLRLRLSTATTAGTTTLSVHRFDDGVQPWLATQPVSGTVTANIGTGSVAAGTNAIGDVGVQYRANATGAASLVSVMSPATPAVGTIKASAGRVLGWQLQNSSAGLRSVKVFGVAAPTLGTTAALFEIDIPAGGRAEMDFAGGLAFGTAATFSVTSAKGLTDNTSTGLAANDVSGAFFFA